MKVEGISLPRANKRLTHLFNQTLALAKKGDIVADIGADHGYLSAMLAKSDKFEKVIATDISSPSLEKTAILAKELNLEIETRVGYGLSVAPETTLACICGMGGYEIIKILQNQTNTKKFVLQPVQNSIELRKYLLKNKYKIISDYVIIDKGKFYYIFSVDGYGKNRYSELEKLFGKQNIENLTDDFIQYLKSQLNKLSFLEKFDIKSVDFKQKRELKKKQKFYKLCKKIIKNRKIV